MTKSAKTLLREKLQVNCARISEIADLCEREKRERNDQENTEYQNLVRENNTITMKLEAMREIPSPNAIGQSLAVRVREAVEEAFSTGVRKEIKIELTREEVSSFFQTTKDLEGTGIIPVSEQEMLRPLRGRTLYDKIGIAIPMDLVGELRWPMHGRVKATVLGEGEKVSHSKIDWDKITTTRKRLSILVSVTVEQLRHSLGIVEDAIRLELVAALFDKLNEILVTTEKEGRLIYGPLATAGEGKGHCLKTTFASDVPTRGEVLEMIAEVASANIDVSTCCFVMTERTKAKLAAQPKDPGSGRFLVEGSNATGFYLEGYPIHTTGDIEDGKIGFGDWSYQPAGFFGPIYILVDPYTDAASGLVNFVINTEVGTATLRPEAFILGVPSNKPEAVASGNPAAA